MEKHNRGSIADALTGSKYEQICSCKQFSLPKQRTQSYGSIILQHKVWVTHLIEWWNDVNTNIEGWDDDCTS